MGFWGFGVLGFWGRLRAARYWRLDFVDWHRYKDIFGVDVIHRYVLEGLSHSLDIVMTFEMTWFAENFYV